MKGPGIFLAQFMADEPPIVSCNSQRSDKPSRQAR